MIRPQSPAKQTSKGHWYLDIETDDPTTMEKIAAIPGARVDSNEGRLYGSIDAVAAACLRMEQLPPRVLGAGFGGRTNGNITLRPYQIDGYDLVSKMLNAFGGAWLCDEGGL